jgi:hypothetical protein
VGVSAFFDYHCRDNSQERGIKFTIKVAIFLAVGFHSASAVVAHDWEEMATRAQNVAQLEIVLGVAEGLQDEALESGNVPALAADALAVDWLTWLTKATRLDTRGARLDLAEELVATGLVAADDQELAVLAWRHSLEHLALVADAVAQGVTSTEAQSASKRLMEDKLPAAEAVRLSYVVWLGSVSAQEKDRLAPLIIRLQRLVERAHAGGGE